MDQLACAFTRKVIMVVGIRLGCMNHALLTAESIARSGCELIGWVANRVDQACLMAEGNIATLQARLKAPLIATLPYVDDEQKEKSAKPFLQNAAPMIEQSKVPEWADLEATLRYQKRLVEALLYQFEPDNNAVIAKYHKSNVELQKKLDLNTSR